MSITNKCGVFSHNDSIRVLPKPNVFFLTSTDSGCSPLPVFIINQTNGLPETFKWYFGNGDSSIRFNPIQVPIVYRTLDTVTIYTIKLFSTNICGIDSMQRSIKVFPNTVRSFFTTSGNTGCQPLSVRFFNFSTGGNQISWSFGDEGTSSQTNPIHTFNKPGVYYAYQFVNNGCSFDTSFVIINVLPKPIFSISKNISQACVNQPIQFASNMLDSGVITWFFGDGDSSNFINPIKRYLTPGQKIIRAKLQSFYNGCITELSDTVFINPLPLAQILADTTMNCSNKYFKFNSLTTFGSTYLWDFGDSNTSAGVEAIHKYLNPGTYNVKLYVRSFLGCIDSTSKLIIVNPVPKASFFYSPEDTCSGPVEVQFYNTTVGGNKYLWNFGNGNTSTLINPVNIYSSVGTYPISLVSSNEFNCHDTATSIYNVYKAPIANIDFDKDMGCVPLDVKFINKSLFGTSFLWYFGDGDTSTEFSPNHKFLSPGIYNVRLIAAAGLYCFDTVEALKSIKVFPKPKLKIIYSIDTKNKPYRLVTFEGIGDSIQQILWDFGDGSEKITGIRRSHRYADQDSGIKIVRAIVTSLYGCDSIYEFQIELPSYHKGLFVPNAFTPDYGLDDVRVFKPVGVELKTYELRIFNKWGELVFFSNKLTREGSPAEGWDGTDLNKKACMQGSYLWHIEASFTDETNWKGMEFYKDKFYKKGNVTLIR
ncbi:MAG: PKD domain-containing protein [Bacteroidia bacterium]